MKVFFLFAVSFLSLNLIADECAISCVTRIRLRLSNQGIFSWDQWNALKQYWTDESYMSTKSTAAQPAKKHSCAHIDLVQYEDDLFHWEEKNRFKTERINWKEFFVPFTPNFVYIPTNNFTVKDVKCRVKYMADQAAGLERHHSEDAPARISATNHRE